MENYDDAYHQEYLNDLNLNKLKLKESLDLNNLKNSKGSFFEVDGNQENSSHQNDSKSCGTQEYVPITNLNTLNLCSGMMKDYNDSNSDSEEEMEPFEILAHKMEDISPSSDGGVLKMEVETGHGGEIPRRSQVLFHYNAFLEFSDEPFDSTFSRKKPQRSRLDLSDTIEGLKIGLQTMRKKEKSMFLIKPQYAFGKFGCPPRVPADATVLYEVILCDATDYAAAIDFDNCYLEEKHMASFDVQFEAALGQHRMATDFFRKKNWLKAKAHYRKAAWTLENMNIQNEEEERQQMKLLFKMHSNLAQVFLELKEPAKACTECRLALETHTKDVDPQTKAKIFFRFGKAKMFLSDFQTARKHALRAQNIAPNNPEIRRLIEEILKREDSALQNEKVLYRKMVGGAKNAANAESAVGCKPAPNLGADGSPNTTKKSKEQLNTNFCDHIDSGGNISEEMKFRLENIIQRFNDDTSIQEWCLPATLDSQELSYVVSLAKSKNLAAKKTFSGQQTIWKLTR